MKKIKEKCENMETRYKGEEKKENNGTLNI